VSAGEVKNGGLSQSAVFFLMIARSFVRAHVAFARPAVFAAALILADSLLESGIDKNDVRRSFEALFVLPLVMPLT
jgi:hypothetical protein